MNNRIKKFVLGSIMSLTPLLSINSIAMTANETGFHSLGLWESNLGAFRNSTFQESQDEHKSAWTDDNSYMLWALSKPVYSSSQSYGSSIRDFLISMSFPVNSGHEFYARKRELSPGQWTTEQSQTFISTLPVWAITNYNYAYPNDGGLANNATWYRSFVEVVLDHWHNDLISPQVVADSRTESSDIAFFMATSAFLYQKTGQTKWLNYAKAGWNFIKSRQLSNGAFPEHSGGDTKGVLRQLQVVYGLAQTWKIIGNYNGLFHSLVNLQNNISTSQNNSYGLLMGGTDRVTACNSIYDLDKTQIAASFHYLGQFNHLAAGSSKAAHETNRYALNGGYVWDTWVNCNETGLNHTGTLEANALAWLVDWWATQ